MALILDTGIIYALYDLDDKAHESARALIAKEIGGLIVPNPVVPEVDYFLGRYIGLPAQLDFYGELSGGHYLPAELSDAGYRRVLQLNLQYRDLRLGFVDAAVIAIAEELGIGRIATLDRRHFGAVKAKVALELFP